MKHLNKTHPHNFFSPPPQKPRQGTYPNNFCSNGKSFANCLSENVNNQNYTSPDWTILNPGSCTCPSFCTGKGSCTSLGCQCNLGYTGTDCSLIDCSWQTCSNQGDCQSIFPGISSCVCEDGFALDDCSATMGSLPEIPALLPYPQYSSWDQYGDDNPIFNESTIAQIYLTISQEDLDFLINPINQNARDYLRANFSFYNGPTTQVLEDIGIRIQGGYSQTFAKKSWKISFSHFVSGRTWAQQKKISLKDASMDPLYLREKASIAAIYSMGAPTQRASHAMVYINGMLWGLYIILEDSGSNEYLNSRFGNDDGSLWKCSGDLAFLGSNPALYNMSYKPENSNADDYGPLENFISVLNLTPDDEFEEQIQTVMNVEFFLRTLTAEVATGNYDGIYNANNYYLYYNTDELMYYYRHDLDLSFGFVDFDFRMSNRSIWEWGSAFPPGPGQLLIDRILAVPSFQQTYASYLSKLLTYVNSDQNGPFAKRVSGMHGSIKKAVSRDGWHSLDMFMYSYNDFSANLARPISRPPYWPPNPVVNVSRWEPFMGFYSFLKVRNSFTDMQLQTGPPSR